MQICAICVTFAPANTICNAQPSQTTTIHISAQLFYFQNYTTSVPRASTNKEVATHILRQSTAIRTGWACFFPPAAEPHFWWLVATRVLQEIKPATHCNTLHHTAMHLKTRRNTLQHTVTYCIKWLETAFYRSPTPVIIAMIVFGGTYRQYQFSMLLYFSYHVLCGSIDFCEGFLDF